MVKIAPTGDFIRKNGLDSNEKIARRGKYE